MLDRNCSTPLLLSFCFFSAVNRNKMSQQTNSTQQKLMLEFMEKHDALAKNSLQNVSNGRAKKKQLWTKLSEILNSNGPPVRPTKGWQKVWTDHKYNAKRKQTKRMESMRKTGGGPYDAVQLNAFEERVIAAAKINAHLMGVPNTTSHGSNAERPCSSTTASQPDESFISECFRAITSDEESLSNDENKTPSETESQTAKILSDIESDTERPSTPKVRRRYVDPKLEIMEKEVENQNKFQNQILKLFKESNEIGQRKVQLPEQQIATNNQYKRMKVKVLELYIEKIKYEIDLLKPKTQNK